MTDDNLTFDPVVRLNGRTIKAARREELGPGRHHLVIEFEDGATFEVGDNEQRLTLKGGQHFAWASTARMEPSAPHTLPSTVTPRQTREKWKNGLQQGASVRVLLDGSVQGWQQALFMRWVDGLVEERAAEVVLIHNHQTVRVGDTRMYPPDLVPVDQKVERLRRMLLARECATGCGRRARVHEATCLPDGKCEGCR